MRADPSHWRKYYHGTGRSLTLQLEYSLSDRIRYYWPQPAVVAAMERLTAAFASESPPLALLSQYLPAGYAAVRAGAISPSLPNLLIHQVRRVLAQYSRACHPNRNHEGSPL